MKGQYAIDIIEENIMKKYTIIGFAVGVIMYVILRYLFHFSYIAALSVAGVLFMMNLVLNYYLRKK